MRRTLKLGQPASLSQHSPVERDRAGRDAARRVVAYLEIHVVGRGVGNDCEHACDQRDIAGNRRGIAIEAPQDRIRGRGVGRGGRDSRGACGRTDRTGTER